MNGFSANIAVRLHPNRRYHNAWVYGDREVMMMTDQLKASWSDEEGATMVEYALMLALIAVVCVAAVQLIGKNAGDKFSETAGDIGDK